VNRTTAEALAAPFDAKDLKTRPGRAGLVFTYADARAVAQRLDDVLGIENWQFEVKVADAARNVVHGTLAIVINEKHTARQDFGYPNSAQDDEPLKSAASDALRRCAAQIGVGRSLYSPDKSAPTAHVAPVVKQELEPKQGLSNDDVIVAKAAMLFAQSVGEDECSHGEAWSLKAGGVSKMSGKPYAPFWAASHKTSDGGWCKDKPSIKWIAAQDAPKPKMVPEDLLAEEIPF
jgi:hypothetical protein